MPNNKPSTPYYATPDEAFWVKPEGTPAEEKPKPKRHVFTHEECQRGFWAAIDSIIARYPNAIMADGRHMACNFLKAKSMARS